MNDFIFGMKPFGGGQCPLTLSVVIKEEIKMTKWLIFIYIYSYVNESKPFKSAQS